MKKVRGKKAPTSLKLRRAGKSEEDISATIETTTPTEHTTSTEPVVPVTQVPPKPKMASIPKGVDPSKVTVPDALKYLSLPRTLGVDPKTNLPVMASAGRFGPYVASDMNYRSIKVPDNVYDITLERALEMLAIPKKPRGFQKKTA